MEKKENVLDNIRTYYQELYTAEKRVADYILQHSGEVFRKNISELAVSIGVSDATVVRTCKHLGYSGFHELRLYLSYELGQDRSVLLKAGQSDGSLSSQYLQNVSALFNRAEQERLEDCSVCLAGAKTVYIVGFGNSIPPAADLAFRLGRLEIPVHFSFVYDYMSHTLLSCGKEDVLVVYTQSGSTKNAVSSMELAKRHGCKTVLFTFEKVSPASQLADIIWITKPEKQIFHEKGLNSHVLEMIANDLLVHRLIATRGKALEAELEKSLEYELEAELLLSESKL